MCLFWREGVKLDASRSFVIHLTLDAGCQAKKSDTCTAMLRHASSPPLRATVLSVVCWACSASATYVTPLKLVTGTSYHSSVAAFIVPRKCLNKPESFCYLCGDIALKSQEKPSSH